MPIDPSIILQAGRGVTPVLSPMEAQAGALKLRDLQQQLVLGQQEQQIRQGQIEERNLLVAQRQRQVASLNARAALSKQFVDDTGHVDYAKVADGLEQAGFGDEAQSLREQVAKNELTLADVREKHLKFLDAQRGLIGNLAFHAKTYDDFVSGLHILASEPDSHLSEDDARRIEGQVAAAGPDSWKAVAQHYAQFSPDFQQQQKEATKPIKVGPNEEVVQNGQVIAKGAPPQITPYQQAQLQVEQARSGETARHNRETERAANPLGIGTPQAGGATPAGATGDAFLKTLPPGLATEVKAYAEGRRPFPAGFALKSPYFQQLIQMVGQYDPTFDAVNYNARAKTRQDFTSGKSASTINALNTVAQHLDRLSTAVDGLHNSWSPTYNSIANFVSKQSGSKAVTNFETDKKAVTDELTRAWRQAGGSEQDIKAWASVLDAANSPQQLHGAIAEMGQLLEGKLSALENQFQQGMGTAADIPIITPAARSVLTKLEQKASGKPTPAGAAPKAPAGWKYVPKPGGGWTAVPDPTNKGD